MDISEAVLLQDGSEVDLGHVVGKGAVSEDDGGFPGRLQRLMPRHEAAGQGLYIGLGDGGRETDEEGAGANGVNLMRQILSPATCRVSMGTQRSRPSLRSSS